jgi:hypothetical protein
VRWCLIVNSDPQETRPDRGPSHIDITKILAAMRPKDIPKDIDKVALVQVLYRKRSWTRTRLEVAQLGLKGRRAHVESVRKKVIRLRDALLKYDTFKWIDRGESVLEALDRMLDEPTAKDPEWARKPLSSRPARSPIELLAGRELPRVYEEFFGKKARYSWTEDRLSRKAKLVPNPGALFIKAALEEMGFQYEHASICHALKAEGQTPGIKRNR